MPEDKKRDESVSMSNFQKCAYWLELAADDLNVAKSLLRDGHLLYCGYFCHLLIEKALKAAIAKNTEEIPPKIHDLPKLAKLGGIFDILSTERKALINKLKPLQIEARYPEYKEQVTQTLSKNISKGIIEETEAFLCWIKQQLEK